MQFHVSTAAAAGQRTGCLIVPVYANGAALPAATRAADEALGGAISELLASRDLHGKIGDTQLLRAPQSQPFKRVLVVGCGAKAKFDRKKYQQALLAAFGAWRKTRIGDAVSYLTAESPKRLDPYRRVRMAVEIWHDSAYRFTAMKTGDADEAPAQAELTLAVTTRQAAQARKGVRHGDAIGQGIALAKDLGNLPGNVCTPSYLAQRARDLAKGNRTMHLQVLQEADMRKLGMGSLLSVTAGSGEPARFIVLRYSGAAKGKAPVVLVGKGITFDAGGISLKPPPQMDEMKYDMCGATSIFGAMIAASELGLPINVVGVIPSSENLPDGNANRPGDIVKSMSGQTIEVLNTDAEGRLILCDALTYTAKYKPNAVIDIATLTGACIIALGHHASGLMANNQELADQLISAGERSLDRVWQLPLWEDYQSSLDSNFADMANIGGRSAGTITAACFLSRFTREYKWAHLDIAGTAWRSGKDKGATGRVVPLLSQYLIDRSPKHR
jgi:leucyl aminopeptidase